MRWRFLMFVLHVTFVLLRIVALRHFGHDPQLDRHLMSRPSWPPTSTCVSACVYERASVISPFLSRTTWALGWELGWKILAKEMTGWSGGAIRNGEGDSQVFSLIPHPCSGPTSGNHVQNPLLEPRTRYFLTAKVVKDGRCSLFFPLLHLEQNGRTKLWVLSFCVAVYVQGLSCVQLFVTPMDCSMPGFLPCPSPSPRACSNSCPLSRWCHPTISSSVVPFSSCLQSFPASGGQSIGASASASILPMNSQGWFPLGGTG